METFKTVLVVEDDDITQNIYRRLLSKKYNLILAISSDEVYELLKNQKPDLIIMDISIKGRLNGLELTKELKASEEYSKIPVIAITAHAFEKDRINSIEAGCNDYISKPFNTNYLYSTIEKFI